jgi:hypothetical protein
VTERNAIGERKIGTRAGGDAFLGRGDRKQAAGPRSQDHKITRSQDHKLKVEIEIEIE